MSKRKPIVGDRLFMIKSRRWSRDYQRETPVEVMTVGRKYFTVAEEEYKECQHMHVTFHLDTWRQKTETSENHYLYESEQEWKDETEAQSLNSSIVEFFRYNTAPKLSLPALRQIKQIIDENKEEGGK